MASTIIVVGNIVMTNKDKNLSPSQICIIMKRHKQTLNAFKISFVKSNTCKENKIQMGEIWGGAGGIELLIECPEKAATRNSQLMYNTCLIK